MKFVAILVAGILSLALMAWMVYLAIGMVECWSKWRRSNMDYEFSSISGCLVEVGPDKWIPDNRYRGIDE